MMRKLMIGLAVVSVTLGATASASYGQSYLDRYRGWPVNDAKDALSRQGFRELGQVTLRRGTYRLMFDGRTCIALHGGRGVIDDIDVINYRTCQDQLRGPPPPPPRWDNRPPPPPPGWGDRPPPPPSWGDRPPPPRY